MLKYLSVVSCFVLFLALPLPLAHGQVHRSIKENPAERAYSNQYKVVMLQFMQEAKGIFKVEPQFPPNATKVQKRTILAKPYEKVAQIAERTRSRYAKLKPPPSFAPIHAATINLFVTLRDTHVQHAKVWRTGKKANIKADSDQLAKRVVSANDHLQKVVAEVARTQGQDAELIKALLRMKRNR